MDNCEQCGKTCYVRVIGMSAGRAICSTCESQVTDPFDAKLAAIENHVVAEKNARIAELERDLERWIEMAADFLSAGATVEAELTAARPIVAAAKAYVFAERRSDREASWQCERALIDAIDAASGKGEQR